jgi:hypothetical protein
MNIPPLELAIVIAILVVVFTVLLKYFKWAIQAVVIFVLALVVLYLALRVIDYGDASGKIKEVLEQVKDILGFNDPKTAADVQELTDDVVETTKIDEVATKFNLKKIWEDIKALMSF